jgi:hypothetical protein
MTPHLQGHTRSFGNGAIILNGFNLNCLGALVSLFHVKTNPLPLIQGSKSRASYGTVVDKNILTFIRADKAVALFFVKPFDRTFRHNHIPLSTMKFSWDMGLTKKATKAHGLDGMQSRFAKLQSQTQTQCHPKVPKKTIFKPTKKPLPQYQSGVKKFHPLQRFETVPLDEPTPF